MKAKVHCLFGIASLLASTLTPSLAGPVDGQQSQPELALGRTPDYDYDPPAPGSYSLPVLKAAGDGKVLGPLGNLADLHQLFEGRLVVLSFIYTRCSDPRACLRATGVMNQLQRLSRADPGLATNLLLLTMSFDPAHDTPEVLARYGRVFGGDHSEGADWLFLTTRSAQDLAPILDEYGQRVDRRQQPSPYGPLYHPVRVYLIDREKQIRNIYSYGLLDPRLVVTDVRTLLMEESK